MYLYENLQKIRTERKISQAEVCKQLNIKQQQYSRYEKGEREIPLHYIIALADFYGVSIDFLVGREAEQN